MVIDVVLVGRQREGLELDGVGGVHCTAHSQRAVHSLHIPQRLELGLTVAGCGHCGVGTELDGLSVEFKQQVPAHEGEWFPQLGLDVHRDSAVGIVGSEGVVTLGTELWDSSTIMKLPLLTDRQISRGVLAIASLTYFTAVAGVSFEKEKRRVKKISHVTHY